MSGAVDLPTSNTGAGGAPGPSRVVGAVSTTPARFTLDGSDALEAHLARVCERVLAGVAALVPAAALEGLLLAGGYGRGEGGVLRTPGGDEPYNDLEFYVFVRGNAILAERRFRDPLHQLGHQLSPEAGLEVEFKVLTLGKLAAASPSMFYYDLVAGHRWLVGDDSLLAGCDQHREPRRIPPHEVTRLLMNRCSGLLFSLERLRRPAFGAEEADFVGRNLAKLQLALGDALLAAEGAYHWSCRERHNRITGAAGAVGEPWAREIPAHHAAGVAFKLHPGRSTESRATLAARHAELTELARELWLWVERRRLQAPFPTARDYALSPVDKCPETSSWRNRLVNARAFGPAAALLPGAARYPRQRLFHALALLLWSGDGNAGADGATLGLAARELRCAPGSLADLVAAYERLWHRFN